MKVIKSKKYNRLIGGLADKKYPKDFDQNQLQKGVKIESEHTNDEEIAEEIAMDHLSEDPKYYDHLIEMEKKVKKKAHEPFVGQRRISPEMESVLNNISQNDLDKLMRLSFALEAAGYLHDASLFSDAALLITQLKNVMQ